MKNKEVLVVLPETKELICTVLYTDKTYEYQNSNSEVIHVGKWKEHNNSILVSMGFSWHDLERDRPNLRELIAWEQIEKEILS
jgi:hypothetical protein